MEGNNCYKYQTVRHFLETTGHPPVRTILEIGTNIGNVTAEMAECFPEAKITSFEIIPEYAEIAKQKLQDNPRVTVELAAVTAAHLYEDDLGKKPRAKIHNLHAYYALPPGGPGYRGGSFVALPGADGGDAYREMADNINCFSLDDVVASMQQRNGVEQIDYLKSDCEGAESSFLGCANPTTLNCLRYIAGEYHNLRRFWPVVQKLFSTHLVSLVGDANLGAFFCEKRIDGETLLRKTPLTPRLYKHLHEEPLWWHPFDHRWVSPEQRVFHGLPQSLPASLIPVPDKAKKIAFVVCGFVSSGNRLVASILCRSGCAGEGSTSQPKKPDDLPDATERPYVCILHNELPKWFQALRQRGFERIVAVIPIREPIACVRSALMRGHQRDFDSAYLARNRMLARNITGALEHADALEIVTYEGLNETFLKDWLPKIGLRYVDGALTLPGQITSTSIENQNQKHYSHCL